MNFANSKAETLYWRPGATCEKVHGRLYRNACQVVDEDGTVLGYSGNAVGAWNAAAASVGWQSLRSNARIAQACHRVTTYQLAIDRLIDAHEHETAVDLMRIRRQVPGLRHYGDRDDY